MKNWILLIICIIPCVQPQNKGKYNSIRNKTINKLDENERNINTLLFGNDQLHLETNKKIFAIVHDFLRQTDRL